MPNNSEKPELIYQFTLDDKSVLEYHFIGSDNGLTLEPPKDHFINEWMALKHNQCDNCPLEPETHNHCPVAHNLSFLLDDWQKVVSFDNITLNVLTIHRTITAKTTAQRALSSLLGLVMATSDCPHTQFFRPMAQFHLPLSTPEETAFRAISTHLVTQFFRQKEGLEAKFNLDGLVEVYNNMHTVNISMKKRIESAVEKDAAMNAVVLLDILAITFPNYLDDELEKLKPLFINMLKD